jgi:hypothetical protein
MNHEEIPGFGKPNRAAPVREWAENGRPTIMINGLSARFLTRAALIAAAGGSTHRIHE